MCGRNLSVFGRLPPCLSSLLGARDGGAPQLGRRASRWGGSTVLPSLKLRERSPPSTALGVCCPALLSGLDSGPLSGQVLQLPQRLKGHPTHK